MTSRYKYLTTALKVCAAMLLLGHQSPVLAQAASNQSIAGQSSAGQSIFGRWLTDDRSAIVRIDRCGAKLCGRIERVLDPKAPENDINNPDARLRTQPLVGTLVLRDYAGSGARWKDGRAYNPKAGESYRSQLQLMNNGALKVTGCVLVVCRSLYWTRA